VFFTSLLPQFVPPGPSAFATMLGLGLVFSCMTLAWLSVYAVAVGRAGDVLARPRVRRAIDGVAGTVLVAFGIRLASQQR
jgi:threonine/homoserine/homoserine lactone efflux protein